MEYEIIRDNIVNLSQPVDEIVNSSNKQVDYNSISVKLVCYTEEEFSLVK